MKTPEQIAEDAMQAFTFVSREPDDDDNDVEEVDYYYIKDQITAAIEADRAQRPKPSSNLPDILNTYIDWLCGGTDYSVYVLDGQTAECTEKHAPSNTGGDCYHDALVLMDDDTALRFVLDPDGSIRTHRAGS